MSSQSVRVRLFAGLAIMALLAIVAAVVFTVRQRNMAAQVAPQPSVQPAATAPAATEPAPAAAPLTPADAGASPTFKQPPVTVAESSPPRIFFRSTTLDANYGKLAFRDGERGALQFAGQLSCEVAYASRTVGICLVARRGVVTHYFGRLFDARTFAVTSEFPLEGTPSRTRISGDASLAAFTVFLAGHGYDTLDFSTQTLILDARTGVPIADLEKDFSVERDGQTIKELDFNFWGVTFPADSNTFFATLSTAGKHYLVRGDLSGRRMTVIHENVECPSVSPDGRQVAYKKRFNEGGRIVWQLHILELASGRETALAERRSIDDQLEWLDDAHVLYSVPTQNQDAGGGTDVWVARADGAGAPRRFIADAYSPSVVR